MSIVTTSVEGSIGLIRIDNPPVNATSVEVRAGLLAAVAGHVADPAVQAILLLCAGRTFIAGADIREFGKPRQPPSLTEVCDALEASANPVVAAVHGTTLGGGFEIALACHYRIAAPGASMGLPEVTLGLIPGAGGANRLARIAGARKALKLAVSGKPIKADVAEALGVIDRIAGADLTADALSYAREIVASGLPVRPTRARVPADFNLAAFEEDAAALTRKTVGQAAPAACVASVRRALTMKFDDAITADRADFATLSAGVQSRALRHAFFAERQAAKLDTPAATRSVERAAIVGAGTMGGGIAMSFAAAGIPVTLIDTTEEALTRGLARIGANYTTSVERGSITRDVADSRLALIATATDRTAAADADLVIEAVYEDLALKREIFADLETIVRPDAILATNTSALDVDDMTPRQRPGRFVGLHFFSPANVMKLVEVVEAASTSPETLAAAVAVTRTIGKVPVVSGNCDGFIGNRMVAKRGAQVDRLLLEGAQPEQVDAALKAFGFPMGPLAINDMSGLDIGYAIRERRGTKFAVADAVVESGRLGQKTGAGYYRYEAGSRTPLPDPEIDALIVDLSARLGVERRAISRGEMTERMLFPLINEGARILEEGIARRASDVDTVWLNGYGWPRWAGGPMFYADETGLAHIVASLRDFARTSGDPSLEPAALLVELADTGSTFTAWDRARAA